MAGSLLLFSLLVAPLHSQVTSGSISGVVRDLRGVPVPGVVMVAENLQTGFRHTLVSDGQGHYRLAGLIAGVYQLRAEAAGFQTLVRRGIQLAHSQALVLDLTLQLGQPSSEITIVGETPLVNPGASHLGGWVDRNQIQGLPLNGRNVFDLALLQTGVSPFPQRPAAADAPLLNHGTWISVNGASVRSNSFLLDGTPVNDATVAASGSIVGTSLGMEAVREFQVLTHGYSAEYGRVAGGIVNAVTRAGSNAFHGSVFEYHRNEGLDSRNFFDPQQKPDFSRNQWGFTLGGPLKKEQAFFFTTTEWLREDLGVTTVSPVPGPEVRQGPVAPSVRPYLDLFPLPNDVRDGVALHTFTTRQPTREVFHRSRFDFQLDPGRRLFFSYSADDVDQTRPSSYPAFSQERDSANQYLTVEGSLALSAGLLSTSRLAYGRNDLIEENRAGFDIDPFKVDPAVSDFPQILVGGFPIFGPTAVPLFGLEQGIWTFSQDLLYARGRHTWKTGLALDRVALDRVGTAFESGRFIFGNLNRFLQGTPFLYIGSSLDSFDGFEFSNTYLAAYLEDEFRLHPKLHLNLGLRYEFASVPEEETGATASLRRPLLDDQVAVGKPFRGLGANWGPRGGFAWSFLPGTVLRGGAGRYYDLSLVPFTVHVSATGMPPFIERVTLPNPPFPNPPLAAPTGVVSPQPVDFFLESPRIDHFNIGIQQQLSEDALLSIGYAGSRGTRLLRRGDVNLAVPEMVDGRLFFAAGSPRRNGQFGSITLIRSDGSSSYHSLQAGLRKRFAGRFSFNAFYVFSRSIDEGSAQVLAFDVGGGAGNVLNPLDRKAERGPADFHLQHRFLVDYAVDLPVPAAGPAWARWLFRGWSLTGIVSLASGPPFDVFVGSNRSRSLFGSPVPSGQGVDRPDLAPGRTARDAVLGGPDHFLDPSAFVLQPAGFFGNLGRNALQGPGFANLDLALGNRRPLSLAGREMELQFRAEVFNLFNHPNFGFPDRVIFSGVADGESPLPTVGLIRSTVNSSRQLQIAVRLEF